MTTFYRNIVQGQNPTIMTDAVATRLGLKTYSHGVPAFAGISPNLSLDGGGGTLTSVDLSEFIPYQTQAGNWRLRVNMVVTVSSASRTFVAIGMVGIATPLVGRQSIAAWADLGTAAAAYGRVNENNNAFLAAHATATTTTYTISGDIKMAVKPTWAY